jgi:hypothetical protein
MNHIDFPSTVPQTPPNIAYFLYIQRAYKPHTRIPNLVKLRERNPDYKERFRLEREERKKGLERYYLKD